MVGEGLFAGRLGSIRLGRGSAAHSRVIDVMLESELMLADSATGTAEVAALILLKWLPTPSASDYRCRPEVRGP
jgi:hypothetical protein